MKSINKKAIIIALVAFLLIISYFLFFIRDDNTVEVNTMNSYTGDIEKTVKISGSVESSDSETINIPVNLEVLNTYYGETDYVEKGDLLAELEVDDLQISLEKAKLNLAQLEKDMEDLNSSSSNSEKVLLSNGVEKSKTNLENIKKDLENAKEDLKTNQVLLENDAISQKEYDNQVDLVESLESSLKNAQISYEDSILNLTKYNSNQEKTSEKLSLQMDSVKLDISNIEENISKRNIYSNLDGIITEFNLVEGRLTNNSSKISIYDDSTFEFVSLVPQEDAVLIEKDMEADVSIDGLTKAYSGRVSKVGKIAEIDSSGGSQTPKVEIRIIIDDNTERFAAGYTGDAVISLEKDSNVLLVRNEAVKNDADGNYVFVVNGDSVEKVYVEVNLSDGYFSSISSGIEEGTEVVLNPPIDLQDGSTITKVE